MKRKRKRGALEERELSPEAEPDDLWIRARVKVFHESGSRSSRGEEARKSRHRTVRELYMEKVLYFHGACDVLSVGLLLVLCDAQQCCIGFDRGHLLNASEGLIVLEKREKAHDQLPFGASTFLILSAAEICRSPDLAPLRFQRARSRRSLPFARRPAAAAARP